MQIVQIVKRFGLVGGMEEYVFRIVTEFAKLDFQVIVLCEQNCSLPIENVSIYEFGRFEKPRWFAHYKFSQRVNRWLAQNPCNK